MSRITWLVLNLGVTLGVLAGGPSLPARPTGCGDLADLVMELASSRSLNWTTMTVQLRTQDRAILDLTAPARLHQFAPIMALADGPAQISRSGGLRTLAMEVQLDAPPSPGAAGTTVSAILSSLASAEGSDATLVLAPKAEGFTYLSVDATLLASETVAVWGATTNLSIERRPDGSRRVRFETRLPPLATGPGAASLPHPRDWTLVPTEGGTALRLGVPVLARSEAGARTAEVLASFGGRLRLLSVTLRPDTAALHASLAPASGSVEGP